ncbi:Dihydroorotate dehydrogenase B (NAD(+)), catalytic subunit [Acaryochloris thomasi RCC1774]|uniref:Dihydroorotate dehydrogenase B (NAD(+)), catalytic subunit n=1 Tax=Acaryochloris thomasi RCC1774 TaxID=1764569 RepID=A0A2W1J9J0_9CYAN|nr:dihydroorotate dehydrogenase-like protein [Acaryochloris thomasi]PZD70890.1 Dihydroorotate dehydrogenase B (NAD(+)), catalytic subunit [Acaryochloris thomasi RCC1774]
MNLNTNYLDLTLRSPLVVGACAPLTEKIEHLRQIEDAGAAAVVMHSLFEEQLRQERFELHHHLTHCTESFAESLSYFPEPDIFHVGAEAYLEHIWRAKEIVDIPIIASLNGSTLDSWTNYAQQIEEAGADALELNIYAIPTDIATPGTAVEQTYIDIVRAVTTTVNIPVAVKLSPFFSNLAYMARRLTDAGANGLVLFNRFYQPDIDLETLEVTPNVLLSTPQDLRLPMRWIAILYGAVPMDLAASSGIHTAADVLKMLMVGANATLLVSVLLRHGIDHIRTLERDLHQWLEEHDYDSVQQLQGNMSQVNCPDPSAYERVQYMQAIQTYRPSSEPFVSVS